jgi:hypothetical protein
MIHDIITTAAVLVAVAAAAPPVSYAGPPVVYQVASSAPLVTATTQTAPAAAAAGVQRTKRDSSVCFSRPAGMPYRSSINTAEAFDFDEYHSQQATSAKTPLGSGSALSNTEASPNAQAYLDFTLVATYDVQTRADKSNAIPGCSSISALSATHQSTQTTLPARTRRVSLTSNVCSGAAESLLMSKSMAASTVATSTWSLLAATAMSVTPRNVVSA